MLNVISAELIKVRKNKMAWIGSGIVAAIPVLLIMKTLWIDRERGEYIEWFMTVLMLSTVVLPIISGLVITNFMQKEYQDKTLSNILTAPVSKLNFIMAKLAVWFLWHLITSIIADIAVIIGFYFLFTLEFTIENLRYSLYLLIQNNLFSFLVTIPIFWITVKQQAMFYPAILAILGFAILEMAGWQISEKFILPASICLWTALSVSNIAGFGTKYFLICSASIIFCGVAGMIGAILLFQKQDR